MCFSGTFSYRKPGGPIIPYANLHHSILVIITPYAGFWRGCVSRTGTPQLFNGVIAGNCTRQVNKLDMNEDD